MAPRVRKAVNLTAWDSTLEWYARGIRALQQKPITDPTSWRYQGAIHGYAPDEDPNLTPGEAMPKQSEQKTFWNQCQHGSWYFLAWHRMYLHYFEEMVAAAIVAQGGPADWALPYWNYSAGNIAARKLPKAFNDATTPQNQPNPLRVSGRNPLLPDGTNVSTADVRLTACLRDNQFVGPGFGGTFGFGGAVTGFHHDPGDMGSVENVPHGAVHVAIGGLMFSFNTAALDPIFWLHHCNIDRLWEVWRTRKPNHANPAASGTWKSRKFKLHDASGAIVSIPSSDVTGSPVASLNYTYDDISDPLGGLREVVTATVATPEMAGATSAPTQLGHLPATAQLAVRSARGPARTADRDRDEWSGPIYLNIENVKGKDGAPSYLVYLNLPDGADPKDREDLCAGLISMFGLKEASKDGQEGGGLRYAFEIGDIVRTLRSGGDWDPDHLRVTFVPQHRGNSAERVATAPAEIGRISVYFA